MARLCEVALSGWYGQWHRTRRDLRGQQVRRSVAGGAGAASRFGRSGAVRWGGAEGMGGPGVNWAAPRPQRCCCTCRRTPTGGKAKRWGEAVCVWAGAVKAARHSLQCHPTSAGGSAKVDMESTYAGKAGVNQVCKVSTQEWSSGGAEEQMSRQGGVRGLNESKLFRIREQMKPHTISSKTRGVPYTPQRFPNRSVLAEKTALREKALTFHVWQKNPTPTSPEIADRDSTMPVGKSSNVIMPYNTPTRYSEYGMKPQPVARPYAAGWLPCRQLTHLRAGMIENPAAVPTKPPAACMSAFDCLMADLVSWLKGAGAVLQDRDQASPPWWTLISPGTSWMRGRQL